MVNIAGSYDDQAEPSSFEIVPAADYRAKLIETGIDDISKNSDKGRCLKLTWQIETGPYDGRLVWQRLNLWAENMNSLDKVIQIANSQFAAIRQATGKMSPRDTSELEHIPCTITVAIRRDPSGQYADQNEVKNVKAISGGAPANTGRRPAPASSSSRQAPSSGQRAAPWPSKNQQQRQEEDIPF